MTETTPAVVDVPLDELSRADLMKMAGSMGLSPKSTDSKETLLAKIRAAAPEAPPAETLDDQFEADSEVKQAPPPDVAPKALEAPKPRVTHAQLKGMIEAHAKEQGVPANTIDAFRFRRERGLPPPVSQFVVTSHRPTKDGPVVIDPAKVWANDEAEAINAALTARGVKTSERHRYMSQATRIED